MQGEYTKFDDWRVKAENINHDMVEFESHIKSENKIGTDIAFIKLQLADNEVSRVRSTWTCIRCILLFRGILF